MFHDQKIFWCMSNILVSVIALIISLVALIRTQGPVMATLNMSDILSKASQSLATSYPRGEVPKDVLNRLIQHIKETTCAFGKENNVLIIAKHALFSEQITDLTETMMTRLFQENVFKGDSKDVQ